MSLFPARRRQATLGLGLLSLVAGALLAAAPAQLMTAAHADDPVTAPLQIGSYNIRAGESLSSFQAGVEFIMGKSDITGLQEAAGNPRHKYLVSNPDWRVYIPPGNKQVPIVWNPRAFEVISASEFKLADGARVEDVPHDNRTVYKEATWAAVARMRQISTGYVFTFINVHLIHGAIQGGKPVPSRPLLYALFTKQVASLRAQIASQQASGLPVYVTGDFNIGYAQDRKVELKKNPYRNLTGLREVATWQNKPLSAKGTFMDPVCRPGVKYCGSYIDQTWGPTGSTYAKVFTKIVHSDHYPIRSTYLIPVPAGYVPPTGTVGFATTHVTSREWNKPWQSRQNPMVFPLTGDLTHGFATVAVTGGNAVEGKDFTLDETSLYDDDPSNDRVVVETVPNLSRNSDKSFTLSLVDPFNTTITQATATGTIVDDD